MVRSSILNANILIRGFCKNSYIEEGFWFFKEMMSFDCDPDVVIYNTLVDGLCKAGKVSIAHNLVNGNLDEAFKVFENMKNLQVPTDLASYSVLIRSLCQRGCVHESTSLIVMMLERNIRQNINLSTENLLLLFGFGLQDKAFQIIELHYKNGYRVKIEEVVQFLCQRGKLPEACKLLLFSMEHLRNIDIDIDIKGSCIYIEENAKSRPKAS
ncbi:hypothetical protein HN51_016849 [Arachis hypogaea]